MATNKTEKYSRLIILMAKGCTKLVRIFTIKTIEKSTPADNVPNPWTIDQFLEIHKEEIRKRKPNPKQMRLLFPACASAVDIEEWDIQLICFILLGVFSVSPDMKMDLKELNKLRNKLCHKGDPSISDTEYDVYLSKLKIIIERLLKEIKDSDLENEMDALVKQVEHGALSVDDTIKVMKYWYDRETHIEHQLESLKEEQKDTSHKVDTLTERVEDRLDGFDTGQSQLMEKVNMIISHLIPGITMPETDVKLNVKNCNPEDEKLISEKLVKLLNTKLSQNFQEEHGISDKTLDAIKKRAIEALSDLLHDDGKEVVKITQSCVIIRLKCPSFQSLRDLWTKCVRGEITKLFEPVQNAIREIDGFNSVCIEAILTESEFWRCMETLVSTLTKCAEQDYIEHEHERSTITAIDTPISAVLLDSSSTGECANGSNDKSGTCVRMRIKPQSFDQLMHIWHTCKSGRLNRHLMRVSEAFQDEFDLHDLSIKATIDEENMLEYLTDFGSAEMKEIYGEGTRDTLSTGQSQENDSIPVEHHTEKDVIASFSTAIFPQQEEQMLEDEVKKDVEPPSTMLEDKVKDIETPPTMDTAIGQLGDERKDDEAVGGTMLEDGIKQNIEYPSTTDTDIGQLEDESNDTEGAGGTMLEDDVKKDIELLSTMDTDIRQMEYERKDDEGVGDEMLGDEVKKYIKPLSTMLEDDVKKEVEPPSTMDTHTGQMEDKRKDDETVGGTMLEDDAKKDVEPLSTMDTEIGQLEDERKDDEAVGGTTDIDIEQLEQLEDESDENEGAGDTTQSMSQSTPLNTDASPSIQHLRTPRDVLNQLVIETGGQTLMDTIIQRVKDMGKIFCKRLQVSIGLRGLLSEKVLQAGENKYFETLERILQGKMKESGKDLKANRYGLDEVFHRSLFACCLEIKLDIRWYRDEITFPWILDIFEMKPYHFYTVVDILREVAIIDAGALAHLTHIEECILENLAWKSDSPLWVCIQSRNQVVPTSAEVSLHIQPETKIATISEYLTTTQHLDAFQKVIVNDDRQVQTNVLTQQAPKYSLPDITVKSSSLTQPSSDAIDTIMQPSVTQQHQPFNDGSFDLFFRKVYHLAKVRLRTLCHELDIYDDDLIQKIWACVEHVITSRTELLKDRHLDRIIMCCIYVMAKVTDKALSFQTITDGYVLHVLQTPALQWGDMLKVYQGVLLGSRNRLTSKCSDTNRASTSSISSPKDEKKEKNSPLMHPSSIWHATKFSSNPLTPTRRVGIEPSFEIDKDESDESDEDSGNLIQFYNQIFIPQIKTFAMRFLKGQHTKTQEIDEEGKELFLKADESSLPFEEYLYLTSDYELFNDLLSSKHKRTAEFDILLGSSASGEPVEDDLKLSMSDSKLKQPLKSLWHQ